MPRKPLMLLCLLATLAGFGARADGPAVGASHVWIREAPPGVSVMAGYMTLSNFTGKPLVLRDISSSDFGSVMLHRTVEKDGMDSMEAVQDLVIPAHGRVVLAPGGYHLMLMQPHTHLFDGDLVTLTLNFSDGSVLTILAPVRRDAPQH